MLPLTTVLAMSVISALAGIGAANFTKAMIGDNTPMQRLGHVMVGMFTTVSTILFLLVHIK